MNYLTEQVTIGPSVTQQVKMGPGANDENNSAKWNKVISTLIYRSILAEAPYFTLK